MSSEQEIVTRFPSSTILRWTQLERDRRNSLSVALQQRFTRQWTSEQKQLIKDFPMPSIYIVNDTFVRVINIESHIGGPDGQDRLNLLQMNRQGVFSVCNVVPSSALTKVDSWPTTIEDFANVPHSNLFLDPLGWFHITLLTEGEKESIFCADWPMCRNWPPQRHGHHLLL